MTTGRAILGVVGLCLTLLQQAEGQFGGQVGELGDLKKLEIRGATTFAADDIKDQLWRNLDVQVAAHPKSPLRDYLATLEEKVAEGYRHAGFWDVQAKCEVDSKAGRPVVLVSEGPRLKAGDIRVEGARSLPVADLVRRLTNRRPKQSQESKSAGMTATSANKSFGSAKMMGGCGCGKSEETEPPVWEQGKPARLDRQTQKKRVDAIKDAFADLGYSSARFFDDVVRDSQRKTVSLVIKIHGEGARTVLDTIDVTGNVKNSREEVIDYLGLQPGMPLSRELCTRLKDRLWTSGRFTKCDVALIPTFGRAEKQGLAIELTEYAKGPRLAERLSPAEEALLKCRNCLMDSSNWPGDLVCRAPSRGVSLVISATRGTLLMLRDPVQSGKGPSLHHAIAMTRAEVGFYNVATGKKYAFSPEGRQLIFDMTMKYCDDPESLKNDQPFRMMFGAGVNSGEENARQMPFRLKLTMEPVAFLAWAHEHRAKPTVADGVVSINTVSDIMRIDAKSGRLLEMSLLGREDGEKEESRKILVAFEKGEFDRQFDELRGSVARHVNVFDAKQPFGSAGKFLVSDGAYWPKQALVFYGRDPDKDVEPEAARILCKLLDGGILKPLDAIAWNGGKDKDPQFKICDDDGFGSHGFMGVAAQLTLTAIDYVFPRDSWPWTLTHETALSIVGKGRYGEEEMFDLYTSNQTGPICSLVAGTANLWTNPPMARKFAARGLKKLDVTEFRKDYQFLVRPDHSIAKHADEIGAALRKLDDNDVAYLVKKAGPRHARYVEAGFRALRQHRDRSAIEALPAVFDALWESGLRDRVAAGLGRLQCGCVPWQQDKVAERPSREASRQK
jgi:hypothetical protein